MYGQSLTSSLSNSDSSLPPPLGSNSDPYSNEAVKDSEEAFNVLFKVVVSVFILGSVIGVCSFAVCSHAQNTGKSCSQALVELFSPNDKWERVPHRDGAPLPTTFGEDVDNLDVVDD